MHRSLNLAAAVAAAGLFCYGGNGRFKPYSYSADLTVTEYLDADDPHHNTKSYLVVWYTQMR